MKQVLQRQRSGVALSYYVDGSLMQGANPSLRGDCSGLCGNCSGLRGDCSGLCGNCSGLCGDCSGLRGDCSGLCGDLAQAALTDDERKIGVAIQNLIKKK